MEELGRSHRRAGKQMVANEVWYRENRLAHTNVMIEFTPEEIKGLKFALKAASLMLTSPQTDDLRTAVKEFGKAVAAAKAKVDAEANRL